MQHIAIIGAGMAGLSAASLLQARGLKPTLFDKGRRPGGRIASREVDGFTFDHGAPLFAAKGEDMQALLAVWQTQGHVMRPAGSEGWIGLPSMNAPMQAMAAPFAVRCSTTVRSLSFTDGAWTIAFAEAGAETPSVAAERFDHLILAVPAPQAAALLATAGISLPEIDATEYAPCWTLMLACEDLHQDYETFASIAGGPIATIIDNDRRLAGNVGKSTFVMHASAAWSRAHSEAAAADVAPVLLRAFEARSVRPVQPHFVRAHRWRFANVERALGEPFIERPDLNLGLCGDWCLGGGIEGAFESGRALARAVLRSVFSDVE